jgi:amphi-Trp domain-containing protein
VGNKEEQDFSHESVQDPNNIVKYLEALLEGIKKRNLHLSTNGESMALTPREIITFEIQAKKRKYRSSLSVKMSWKEGERQLAVSPLEIEACPA